MQFSDLTLTLTGLSICAVIGAFSFVKHFKKRDSLKAAPIVPWIIPALAALATGFMLMVHLFKFHIANVFF